MKYKNQISKLRKFVKESLKNDKTGHDYSHVQRVLRNSLKISKNYPKIDQEILTVACLLHDISYKNGFVKDHHIVSAKLSQKILKKLNFSKKDIQKIKIIIEDHVGMFSNPLRKNSKLSIESKILRDADNLDSLGKIGVKRMISFSKKQGVPRFISKKDKLNESLYGNLKFLFIFPNKMLTKEAKRIGNLKLGSIQNSIKKIIKKS